MTATLEHFESLEAEFNRLEAERSKKMKKVYANTLTKLYEIAFQQKTMNLKLIESEVMALNQSILKNRYIQSLSCRKKCCVF